MDRATATARIRERHARVDTDDLYAFLGLAPDASVAEVRTAYRELAREFHQDRFQGVELDDETRRMLQAVFARLTEAQQTLTHAGKREAYDASLRGEGDDEVSVDVMKEIFAAEEAFRRGKMHLERGQYDKALERFTAVIATNPEDPDSLAYFNFARFVTEPVDKRGKRSDAAMKSLRVLEELSRAHEALATPALLYGKALRLEDRTDEAAKLFKRVQRIDPKHADAQRELRLIEMRKSQDQGKGDGAASGGFFGKLKEILTKKR